MARFFIARPVFAIVLALIIVLAGLIAGLGLPIAQYPQITLPTIVVNGAYPGASALTVEQSVAQPIEEQVNGVDGMLYMESSSSGNGAYSLSVTFGLDRNADIASVQVQNRVGQANARLPSEVLASGVTTSKSTPDTLMYVALYSPKGSYDALFLTNYANINVVDTLKRVSGVGAVQVFGSDFGMRIWLKPDRMARLGVTTSDVRAAILEQNVQAPAGQVGQFPSPPHQAFQYGVEVRGRLVTRQEFEAVIVKAQPDGSVVRVRDIARVELGARDYATQARFNGGPAAAFGINLTPDASAVETSGLIHAQLKAMAANFPPDMAYQVIVDRTVFVTASLEEVAITLAEAMLLVLLVVFIFLQSPRATLIPMLAVPVSLIGTLGIFWVMGFTLNTLTLFGMVLAIGIVVDDAIVVVEAVEHHMAEGMDARAATLQAMSEVSGPVVAVALVLAAVFVPVAFLGGIAGALYRQFAVTVAVSTLLSAFVALTLTPALCATLLRPQRKRARFFDAFNRGFERMQQRYIRIVGGAIRRLFVALALLALFIAGAAVLLIELPTAFVPPEDQGYIFGAAILPEASALTRTIAATEKLDRLLEKTPGVERRLIVNGFNILTRTPQSNGALFVAALQPWEQRKGKDKSLQAVIGRIFSYNALIPEATVIALNPPALPGLGAFGGFNLKLQDRQGSTPLALAQVADDFIAAAKKRPEIGTIRSGLNPRTPSYRIDVDREKAKKLGVPVTDVFNALQTFLGGLQVNDFNSFGRSFRVTLQAEPEYRADISAIKLFHVRSSQGEMVPLSSLVTPVASAAPAVLQRFNQFREADITGDPAPGFSAGQAIAALEAVAASTLPQGYGYEWSGLSRQEKESAGQAPIVFGLAVVFVFLFLAALYESWAVPFAVMLAVPIGMFGALAALWAVGLTNNIYAQIGLILLIGLAAKNAILIVEFAKIRRDEGMDAAQAAIAAAQLRLRPILMTSLAFILGVMPLVFASGAGAAARVSMGITVCAGMIVATLFGVFMVPVLFVAVERAVERVRGPRERRDVPPAPEAEIP